MFDSILYFSTALIAFYLAKAYSRIERLEGVTGADRRLVTPDAERTEGQEGEEQRSVDDMRVTPGEAEGWLQEWIDDWRGEQDDTEELARKLWDESELHESITQEREAEVIRVMLNSLINARARKPDSDAEKPKKPHVPKPEPSSRG